MNALYPKALTLLRILGGSLVLAGALVLSAYILKGRHDGTPVNPLRCLSLSIPLVIGAGILLKSSA